MSSPILNTLPSIGQIVALLPPGGNPYSFGLKLVESSAFPSVEKRTYTILIILSIIHACTIIFCGTVISIPCWRKNDYGQGGHGQRNRMIWLLKKIYISERKKTYWIPNTSLAVAICQLLTSCFCEIYTYVDYASLKSPEFAGKMSLGICVQFMWLFSFYSYFVTSWGALNTCLCSPHPASVLTKRVISRPVILYILCTGVPILVTIITLSWSIILAIAYRQEIQHITLVRDLLITASNNWESKANPAPDEFINIVKAGDSLLKATGHLISCLKWNSFTWAFLWTITGIFYTHSVWPLVKLMKSCSNRMRHIRVLRVNENPNLITQHQTLRLNSDPPVNQRNSKDVGKVLRRAYIFLVCHCTVMTISVIYTILVCLIIGTHTEKVIVVAQWRSLGSWLYLVSGGFSAIAMLFQSWRSYTETDLNVNKSTSTCISTSSITSIDLYHKLSYKLGRKPKDLDTMKKSRYEGNSLVGIKEIEPVVKDIRWSDEILIIRNPNCILRNDVHDLEILKKDLEAGSEDHDGSFKSLSPLMTIAISQNLTS
ncbi:hypothetical protein DFH28DRAFT_285960 [Melampsora americana]|nr:hypothetical protein DFH28DRAFT_285960 [Melampsora americana]